MTYQDFRYRGITWYLFPILFSLGITWHFIRLSPFTFLDFLINLSIVAIQLGGVGGYIYYKYRTLRNIFDEFLGIGDVLFLICLCLFFVPTEFIIFVTLALFLSLIIVLITRLFRKEAFQTIPLA